MEGCEGGKQGGKEGEGKEKYRRGGVINFAGQPHSFLVDVSDIFYFFCSGEGKGECEAPGGGGAIFYGKS